MFLLALLLSKAQAASAPKLEMVAELAYPPGGMTVTSRGDFVVSLHQFARPRQRVIRFSRKGELIAFPEDRWSLDPPSTRIALDAVLGVRVGDGGIVWMLDNGLRGEVTPKLVGWDVRKERLFRVIHLPPPVTVESSFVIDLAVDADEGFIYLADMAEGKRAALIVVDIDTGNARRLLEGHTSTTPEEIDIVVDGKRVEVARLDGSRTPLRMGVSSITVDRKGSWVYFCPTNGRVLYRVDSEDLRDESLSPVELGNRVEAYSPKPVSTGLSIDSKGNIYLRALAAKAIGVLPPKTRSYMPYLQDPRLLWPGGLCFGTDGKLCVFTSQLHRMPYFNSGKDETVKPFRIFKFKALSSGSVGR